MNIAQRFQIQLLRKNRKLKNQKTMNLNQPRGTVLCQLCHLITLLQAITSATSSTRDNASQCSDSYACIFSTATSTSNGKYKTLRKKIFKKNFRIQIFNRLYQHQHHHQFQPCIIHRNKLSNTTTNRFRAKINICQPKPKPPILTKRYIHRVRLHITNIIP